MKAETVRFILRMLTGIMVSVALLVNVVLSINLLRSLDAVQGDCMGRGWGQLFIIIDVALTAISLLGSCFLFWVLARWSRKTHQALLWSAAVTALAPGIVIRGLGPSCHAVSLIAPPVVMLLLECLLETQWT